MCNLLCDLWYWNYLIQGVLNEIPKHIKLHANLYTAGIRYTKKGFLLEIFKGITIKSKLTPKPKLWFSILKHVLKHAHTHSQNVQCEASVILRAKLKANQNQKPKPKPNPEIKRQNQKLNIKGNQKLKCEDSVMLRKAYPFSFGLMKILSKLAHIAFILETPLRSENCL